MRRCSLAAGGIERAGIITAARAGATCRVGSGEGIGVRRTGTAIVVPCVALWGVVALALVTVFAVRTDLAFFFPAAWRAFGFGDGRDLERDLPLPLLRDAAAFNCFPLFGLTTPEDGTQRPARSALPRDTILAERSRALPSFFRERIQCAEPGRALVHNYLIIKHLIADSSLESQPANIASASHSQPGRPLWSDSARSPSHRSGRGPSLTSFRARIARTRRRVPEIPAADRSGMSPAALPITEQETKDDG